MKIKVRALQAQFSNRALDRGGAPLYNFATALEVLAAAKAGRFRLYGIDGLHITPTSTQPDQDHTLDLSDAHYDYEAAEEFLYARRQVDGLYFEFVLDEPDEFGQPEELLLKKNEEAANSRKWIDALIRLKKTLTRSLFVRMR